MSVKDHLDPEHAAAYGAMQAAVAAAAPEHKDALRRAVLGWLRFVAQNTYRRAA